MKYLVAVSGGIDSVVLLDKLSRQAGHELIVAHFDHGIRPDSAADARFVKGLAAGYGLEFVGSREELGKEASEELARNRRYRFLFEEADKRRAIVVTAHHSGDVIETMAINLLRGTGWRGIAVMDSSKIVRPLLSLSKSSIRDYALRHRLEWVEDSTNATDDYLRNRVRRRIGRSLTNERNQEVLSLHDHQVRLKREIDSEVATILNATGTEYSRYFFICITPVVAAELLREIVVRACGVGPTRPQVERAIVAIKTLRPHTAMSLGGVWLKFGGRTFTVSVKTP